jgi:hypothetical protein
VCPTLCLTGPNRPAGGCRLKTEAAIGESHVGPKKSAQAAAGFGRQAVGIGWAAASSTSAVGATGGS